MVFGESRIYRLVMQTFVRVHGAIDDVEEGRMNDDKSGGGEV